MDYTYPASDLDNQDALLRVPGSLWSDTYQGADLVASVLYARGRLDLQLDDDFHALLAAVSRLNVPVLHRQRWQPIRLLESERNTAAANFALFNGVYTFAGEISYDVPVGNSYHVWPAADDLRVAPLLCEQISRPSAILLHGIDFVLRTGGLWFRQNPFNDDRIPKRSVFEDGVAIDRECILWLHNGGTDSGAIHEQFGYVLGFKLPSTLNYRDAVNAVYDALVEGTSARAVRQLFSACCDVPLAKGGETVEHTFYDRRACWVITDQNAYRLHSDDTPAVEVGQALEPGDPLGTALRFHEFNRGILPADLRALAVGTRFMAAGYFSDLVFENKTVDLGVEENVNGYTRVSFEVGGFPYDVEKFWDDIHTAGVAAEQTLAMLLDQRPAAARDTQPTALALPATINPLGFMIANIFRNNYFVARVRPSLFGPNALGLAPTRFLHKIVPPHTACIILSEIASGDDIIMDGDGDEHSAGYEEAVSVYLGLGAVDEIDASVMIEESVRCYQVGGHCE